MFVLFVSVFMNSFLVESLFVRFYVCVLCINWYLSVFIYIWFYLYVLCFCVWVCAFEKLCKLCLHLPHMCVYLNVLICFFLHLCFSVCVGVFFCKCFLFVYICVCLYEYLYVCFSANGCISLALVHSKVYLFAFCVFSCGYVYVFLWYFYSE